MTDDPALAELLTLWLRLTDEARQSPAADRAGEGGASRGARLDRSSVEDEGSGQVTLCALAATIEFKSWHHWPGKQ